MKHSLKITDIEGALLVRCINNAVDKMRLTGCTTNPFVGCEPFAAKENMRGFKGYLAKCLVDVRDGCIVELAVTWNDLSQIAQAVDWNIHYYEHVSQVDRSSMIKLANRIQCVYNMFSCNNTLVLRIAAE